MSKGFRDFDLKSIVESCDTLGYGGKISTITDLEHYCSMKRKEILQRHKNSITELRSGKYEGWYQTFAKDEKTGKRKLLRANSRAALDDKILAFYTNTGTVDKHTIEECFNGWIEYLSIDKKPSSIRFYKQVFKRHFMSVKNLYIEDWEEYQIKVFSKKEIARNKLTQKGYSTYKTVLFGFFHFAKDHKYITVRIEEVAEELRRELRGSFAPSKRRLNVDDDYVLSKEEYEKIKDYCVQSGRLDDLGIALMQETGIRVGELASLRKTDVSPDMTKIYIYRTEERVSSGADYAVSDRPKTENGIRKVLLTKEAKGLVDMIIERSNNESDYLFSDIVLERFPTKKFRDRLLRICSYVGIKKRSPHALRRTYITSLYETGVPEDIIIKQVGHVDFDITKKYYIFNRKSDEEMVAYLEKKY